MTPRLPAGERDRRRLPAAPQTEAAARHLTAHGCPTSLAVRREFDCWHVHVTCAPDEGVPSVHVSGRMSFLQHDRAPLTFDEFAMRVLTMATRALARWGEGATTEPCPVCR